jgi:hypothetical protein
MYPQTHARLERCKFLWDEYKYRHDLIWQRVFRFTTAIVLISVIPYVQEDIARIFGPWIITAPLLASLLALFVLPVMCYELCLFNKIKKEYEEQQNRYLGKKLKDPGKVSLFEWFVMVYFVLLLALSIVNSGIALLVWIPRLLDRTACV